jgi:small subunit ribosomal protein S10e
MLIPKKNKQAVYVYLFTEGVMVAKKDPNAPKHHLLDVPNLHVLKTLQSLKSRGYVTEKFSWQWFYWYLTNEGTTYLRSYLNLPNEIVPGTLKPKPMRTLPGGRGERFERGDRDYERRPRSDEKKEGAPADYTPSFRGGRGGFGGDRGDRGDRGFGGDRGDRGFGGDRGDRGFGGGRGGHGGEYRRSEGDRGDRGFGGGRGGYGGDRAPRN